MTLDKHKLDGINSFTKKILPAARFDSLLKGAGYIYSGSAPAKGGRVKIWWTHSVYRRVEAIYSKDKKTVITAYHVI